MSALSQLNDNGLLELRVWAPLKKQMQVHIIEPQDQMLDMQKDEEGFFHALIEPNQIQTYFFRNEEGQDLPDPASEYQPDGVHGKSQLISHDHAWNDQEWKGIPMADMIMYEIHVGTFTPEGTFDAIIPRLDALKETGINTLELMPICQFPGTRNWGYDVAFPYAVQNSYGGPEGLKRLVDACHQRGIAVLLDVVYNHLGPEGNYLPAFGPYFTNRYRTPWGDAINFDDAWSDGVREFFAKNPAYWFNKYHIDGLRCDAVHTIFDIGAVSIWELIQRYIKEEEQRQGRPFIMIAESDLNSMRVTKDPQDGGMGFTGLWLDDFHHALYTLLDPCGRDRYYDFGAMEQLARAFKEGFVHTGQWVKFRKRHYGGSSAGVPGDRFVVFNVNHDQVGNRVGGERLCMLVDENRIKLAAAAMMLSPYVPMLFMGEEYGDDTPFFYFVSHSNDELVEMVRKGRMEEFKEFGFTSPPPDPQDENTFKNSVIHWEKRDRDKYRRILDWHKTLIRLRQQSTVLRNVRKEDLEVVPVEESALILMRRDAEGKTGLQAFFNFSDKEVQVAVPTWLTNTSLLLSSEPQRHEDTKNSLITLPPASLLLFEGEMA